MMRVVVVSVLGLGLLSGCTQLLSQDFPANLYDLATAPDADPNVGPGRVVPDVIAETVRVRLTNLASAAVLAEVRMTVEGVVVRETILEVAPGTAPVLVGPDNTDLVQVDGTLLTTLPSAYPTQTFRLGPDFGPNDIIEVVFEGLEPLIVTCPDDLTVACGDATDPSATGTAAATSSCPGTITISSEDAIIGECPTVIERTWTATDACGDVTTCVQTITIEDTEPPTLDCPAEVVLDCSADTDPATAGLARATDACDPSPTLRSDDVVVSEQPRVVERTWTAVDACGNSASCVQTIRTSDETAPRIACPENVDVACLDEADVSLLGEATATDNCDAEPAITHEDALSGECPLTIERTWSAVDAAGNVSTCVQQIIVNDEEPPAISCPDDIEVICEDARNGDGFDIPADPRATATDNCDPNPDLTYSDAFFDGCPAWIERTWVATDACGNSSECVQVITLIEDASPPTIECPPETILPCGASIDPEQTGWPVVMDDCDPNITLTYEDIVYEERATDGIEGGCATWIERIWTAMDQCEQIATCTQWIALVDQLPPTITCPADITLECEVEFFPDPSITGEPEVSDDCEAPPFVFYEDEAAGECPLVITRTWTAVDLCGRESSCEQMITIEDTQPPVLECEAEVLIDCATMGIYDVAGPVAYDACDSEVSLSRVDQALGECPLTILRTWTAIDDCGNESVCTQTLITSADFEGPVILCPEDVTLNCGDPYDPEHAGAAIAWDSCDPEPIVAYEDGEPQPIECGVVIERIWTAIDACGNESVCTQAITFADNEDPVITCPPDIDVECDESTDPDATGWPEVADDCDPNPDLSYDDEVLPGGAFDQYVERTWTAIDACGRMSTCVQIITQAPDSQPPLLTCPEDATVECGDPFEPDVTGDAIATDLCDPQPELFYEDQWLDTMCPQIIERVWTAVDAAGFEATCSQFIFIEDTLPPELTCPPDTVTGCDGPFDPQFTGMPDYFDACDPEVFVDYSDVWDGTCPGVIVRTWIAVDMCENLATCDQIIEVTFERRDGRPPKDAALREETDKP